jgi:hypothetical protein
MHGKRVGCLCMKKSLFLLLLSSLLVGVWLSHMVCSAFAAPAQVVQQGRSKTELGVSSGPGGAPWPSEATSQQNEQSFQGVSGSNNQAQFVGGNQANSGNPGENRGWNQDDSNNAGNMVSGQKKSLEVQENTQSVQGSGSGSGTGNSTTLIGSNQGNSGNEGVNFGNSQDNANNSGNQVNNQANRIGTQINTQGSVINNQGNVIGRQITYLSLLPGLALSVGLHPLHLNLSTAAPIALPQAAQQDPKVTAAGSKARR